MKPMSSNTFKLTFITAAILSSTSASAALYQVVEVTPDLTYNSDYVSAYGVAIQPGVASDGSSTLSKGCFDSTATNCSTSNFTLGGETRVTKTNAGEAVDGLSFREEAPFAMDNAFYNIQDSDDFENYCDNQLLYSTCETWASLRWNLWNKEITGDTTINSYAFTGSSTSGTLVNSTYNTVINSIDSSGDPVGIQLTPGDVTVYRRNTVDAFPPNIKANSYLQSRAWKTDGIYTVGSVSTSATNTNGTYYSSKAAMWNSSELVELNWPSNKDVYSNSSIAQGSLRDFVIVDGTIYAVGYNSFYDNRNYMEASISKVAKDDFATPENWTTVGVTNAKVYTNGGTSGDYIYSNTRLTSVNSNLIAIGEAKRQGSAPSNGAAANRLFVVSDVSASSPSATFLSDGIFFDGAGGKAGAINSYNEIVGQIDAESTREASGKPRRKRGFIYPYNGTGTDSDRRAVFNNQGWWLDNLTNGGTYSSNNNQYRIIDATDINDAGVISATALKCDGGYDTTSYNATCGGGSQDETTVAVKLVPIAGATSDDISERGTDDTSTERSGGGIGLWMFAVLGFLGFRRK
ncbi:DUF3466 family protein [Vibrio fluvialis]|uniref:GlyGly-CTERM sorting domain-containing protein n=1 Tax=Vibrio fluvialis PG41 TaxID=1336752 RepID=S7JB21_VIBFL|nr:DUF3466 family protein [Vibrio fluvialis]EKO3467243.1 DUF3466 family protein [Vibrio fluvialis]EPP21141.1 hypothetical protein L910_1569 [Vibrio fluvialis PG41]MBL4259246.1 DUF3466 family protein [Vibrio fluvialis]MBY7803881.1 DUF3466 family protein [Vibrio fluvialis]MBY7845979.1 DUF3466 family protein [Vibrio fluvialis]